MQMCPDCGYVYDESEYARCPRCYRGKRTGKGIISYHQVKVTKAISEIKLDLYN